ncbi:hypothetical protein MNBD_NITROSPIRAE03-1464 [hydrothermal vent metagenome]|uniref:Doubled CXXCH motif domain-containing protein n=1 Tax=hydrothermal vent metagenome TaxID=652676 RepID=A0A3B1CJ68_9ZZZZ
MGKALRAKGRERGFKWKHFHALCSVFFTLFSMFLVLSFPSNIDARVKGKCKNCHTMHAVKPNPVLTKGGCLGCHAQDPSGTRNIIIMGKTRIPQVIHNMDNGDLAAGNFYYVSDDFNPDYSKGHNVLGISLQEPPPMDAPPGFMGNVVIPGGIGPSYWPQQQQLTCAGTWGCHGNRTVEKPFKSIYGAHHADDSVIDGSTVGRSYRFLYGIKGKEHKNWEYQATTDDHNGYKGDTSHSTMDTISYLCGECHGKFHPNPDLGGETEVGETVWLRHPTDIAFSSVRGGYVGSEFQGYTSYSLQAPVAYKNPTGRENIVDMDSIIMCPSCHRAHASPYQDMLRWDYSSNMLSRGDGCLTCHTQKGQ